MEQLALDLPKFMESSGREKAQTLLKIIGVGDQLDVLDKKEKELYNSRLAIGRIADQKRNLPMSSLISRTHRKKWSHRRS